jgi:Amino acid synthesis
MAGPKIQIRKYGCVLEATYHDGGRALARPCRKAAALAVITNPFAGRYVEDLSPLSEFGTELGRELTRRVLRLMGAEPREVQSYGKATIVGEAGELEHGAAFHHPIGFAMREILGAAPAIVPSTKKVAGVGARIDVPLQSKDNERVRSHFDAIEAGANDAPRADEIVVLVALADGPRPYARVGGLTYEDALRQLGGKAKEP